MLVVENVHVCKTLSQPKISKIRMIKIYIYIFLVFICFFLFFKVPSELKERKRLRHTKHANTFLYLDLIRRKKENIEML